MIVRQFISWVRNASAGERAEATRSLARAWLFSALGDDDRAAAEGALLMLLGPTHGILLNAFFYLPTILWLWKAPYSRAAAGQGAPRRALLSLSDVTSTLRRIGSHKTLLSMILLQSAMVGFLGFGAGTGLACFMGWAMQDSMITFTLPWQVLAAVGVVVMAIVTVAAAISLRKVMKLEPGIVFRG